jgi:glycosyltransferase involved in cell wall biosynthesis
MKVTFILNRPGDKPIGGFKVVYEYANGLVRSGHSVTVVHAPPHLHGDNSPAGFVKRVLKFSGRALGIKDFSPKAWFSLDPGVKLLWAPSLHARWIPDGDAVVATAWQTAEWMAEYPSAKGRKFYLIQDFEYYMTSETSIRRRMEATYKSFFANIAISPAVINMVESCGGRVGAYIPNGMDFGVYRVETPIEAGSRTRIGFPTRREHFKRTEDAVEALEIVREKMGSAIDIWSFGGEKPEYIPDWIEYHERPSDSTLRGLYNSSRIFVVPSLYEGWGLPGSEAMACGAALVSTDNGGVSAYAEHENTALLSPPQDSDSLAGNILRLLRDDNLRVRLATQGHRHIRQFMWDYAVKAFEEFVCGRCSVPGPVDGYIASLTESSQKECQGA